MHLLPLQSPTWLPGGHLQTVWRKLSATQSPVRERQRILLRDGDFIDVDHARVVPQQGRNRPWVLLVHGLGGSSSSPYILTMQSALQQQGYASVAMNLRGCSGAPNWLPVSYHSGCSDDVEQVLTHLSGGDFKDMPLIVIGYSLGANVLVKWATETGFSDCLRALVSVSNPFSLDICCARLNQGLSYWYGRHFLRQLCGNVELKKQQFRATGQAAYLERLEALGPLQQLRTLWEFDEAVTAPLHGFANARHYYESCSSRRFIGLLRVPALLVHGLNDPIIPPQALPRADEIADTVILDVQASGGHVGFPSRHQKDWLEQRILRFIELT
jgi:uncharacterized protein